MGIVLKHDEIVSKVFNNNIILVNSDEKEKILFAKGIGFGKKKGAVIEAGSVIDKIFTIENHENINNFNDMMDIVDSEFFGVCEEAIYEVSNMLNKELNERIHIALIDHLFFAVKRMKNNESIENPFLVEIKTLYKKEFELAKVIANMISDYSKIPFPEGEMGFIALHIHSAIYDSNLSNNIKSNYLGSVVIEYVEGKLDAKIDRTSLDYARFLTHIKFAVQRILNNKKVDNELGDIIKNTYKLSYEIAKGACEILERELKHEVSEDEITFLAIHIERFRKSLI